MSRITNRVEQQLDRWFEAVKSGDPSKVMALYASDAVLLATLRGDVKRGHEKIREYFVQDFLPLLPVGRALEQYSRALGDVGVNSGTYQLLVAGPDSGRSTIDARFTFVYQWIDEDWKIIEHHSSFNPESPRR